MGHVQRATPGQDHSSLLARTLPAVLNHVGRVREPHRYGVTAGGYLQWRRGCRPHRQPQLFTRESGFQEFIATGVLPGHIVDDSNESWVADRVKELSEIEGTFFVTGRGEHGGQAGS